VTSCDTQALPHVCRYFCIVLSLYGLVLAEGRLSRAMAIYNLAKTSSAPETETSPGLFSFSAYTTLPWSKTIAQRPLRSPMPAGQPYSLEKKVLVSLKNRTSSPLTPLTLPQAFMTQLSLDAMVATMSTPFSLNLERFLMYGGRW
jgi:hypothetical protein